MTFRAAIIAALTTLLLCPMPTQADTFYAYLPDVVRIRFDVPVTWATVSKIVDGDTVWVDFDGDGLGDDKVRYIGIDTPETYFGVECYGPEAKQRNAALVADQRVALERDLSDVDRYGRLLRYVYLGDGTWVNGTLVRQGYALVATYKPDTRYETALRQLQATAIVEGAGGWTLCGW